MSISEDGVWKTIEESNVIIKNWVLFQIGWWGKVLFEWVAFEWVDETHKGDKWVGGAFQVRKQKGRGLR